MRTSRFGGSIVVLHLGQHDFVKPVRLRNGTIHSKPTPEAAHAFSSRVVSRSPTVHPAPYQSVNMSIH